jgi:hypothetical protein
MEEAVAVPAGEEAKAPDSLRPGRGAEWLGARAVLAVLGTAMGLLLFAGAELAARALAGRSDYVALGQLHEYSEAYGWTPRPGAAAKDRGTTVTVNAGGYRGRLVAAAPDPGLARVLMLGDSVAFGTGVDDGATFSDIIDARDNGIEVVNLAVQGYGLDQSLLKLEREGLAFEPHVVVLNVCLANDFADTASRVFLYDRRQPKPYFEIASGDLVLRDEHLRLPAAARLRLALARRSHLLAWLGSGARAASAPEAEHWVDRRDRLEAEPRTGELASRVLERIRAAVEARNARLVILLHPDFERYLRGSRWKKTAFAPLRARGVRVIDMRRHYREGGLPWEHVALDDAGHLTPAGHRIVADRLEAEIVSPPGDSQNPIGNEQTRLEAPAAVRVELAAGVH